MIFRLVAFLLFITVCISCKYISGSKDHIISPEDIIVDFSTVDVSPSFKECEQLTGIARNHCFRVTIRKKFTKNLNRYKISSNLSINEMLTIVLIINQNGKMSIQEIQSSELIENNLTDLPYILDTIISNMPELLPATKRGIPVTTQYKLPVKIKTKE